jgi:three-Cys-motif partner protein
MANDDRAHFEEYKEQTRIKHEILTKYLKPYFGIRAKGAHKNLVYIDGFAGAGQYQSESGPTAGSPLLALSVFERLADGVGGRVTPIFIEKDPELFAQLQTAVAAHHPTLQGLREPDVVLGTFESEMDNLWKVLGEGGASLAPSFLFADPCGVSGLAFRTLVRYLKQGDGEALLFFNYDGVTRIAGLGFKPGAALSQLLGSDDRARELIDALAGNSVDREDTIVSFYLDALASDVPDLFSTAFRIESEQKKKTSHYLIHLTRNALGFRVMKEVMWPLGRSADGGGGLALEQASMKAGRRLFRPEWDAVKQSVLDLLAPRRSLLASYFYKTLSEQPGNKLSEPAYRKALLELEAAGKIVVRDKDGKTTTAATRRKRNGLPTLSETHTIAIP